MLSTTASWPALLMAAQRQMQHGTVLTLVLVAIVTGAVVLELSRCLRRAAFQSSGTREAVIPMMNSLGSPELEEGKPRLVSQLLPELCGLVFMLAAAGALLLRGPESTAGMSPEDRDLTHRIHAEWPTLFSADSLLGLQSMLRSVVLASAALRLEQALTSPIAGFPTAFLTLAACARVALIAMSPPDVYRLDGPLGGATNVALEVGALALLLYLATAQARRTRCRALLLSGLATAASAGALAWAAHGNRLAIANPDQWYLDALFSLRELLELAASVTFLANAVRSAAEGEPATAFVAFAHTVLPLQQLLSAYFLLTAFGGGPLEEMPGLVGAGRPFEMLQLVGVVQVGAYAAAGVARLVIAQEIGDCGDMVEV
mmetsp:Transcript_82210/g.255292  ORF Transcript_82210/g.255292 Transcript_82210/m.255292 type:complete len:373 (+) Transcript_82210:65-1183(+)